MYPMNYQPLYMGIKNSWCRGHFTKRVNSFLGRSKTKLGHSDINLRASEASIFIEIYYSVTIKYV